MKTFWQYIAERERIRERRAAGNPPPWTRDPILRDHSFTNVRRIDDPDTLRSIELVGDGARTPFEFLWRTYAYRCLNRAETFEKYGLPFPRGFARWRATLDAARARGEPIGAAGHLTFWAHHRIALERITPKLANRVHRATSGIEAVCILAKEKPTLHVGPYLGTLIVSDLALSRWGGAFGSGTTVPIANGARVGLEIVRGLSASDGHLLFAEKGTASRQARSLRHGIRPDVVARVFALAAQSERRVGFKLTFIDVENCLCEYSRYARIAVGLTGLWRTRIERADVVDE